MDPFPSPFLFLRTTGEMISFAALFVAAAEASVSYSRTIPSARIPAANHTHSAFVVNDIHNELREPQ